MDELIFTYHLTSKLIMELKCGRSITTGLSNINNEESLIKNKLYTKLQLLIESSNTTISNHKYFHSVHLNQLLQLILKGMKGYPIAKPLIELEDLVCEELQNQLELKIENLSFELMIPLLIFIFPSMMYLFISPLIKELLESF